MILLFKFFTPIMPHMKNLLLSFLIMLMALPALLPWMPHGALHALHEQRASHNERSSHSGDAHQHEQQHLASGHADHVVESGHHEIAIDIVTYFNDYLKVDLQTTDQIAFTAPSQDMQDLDFDIAANFLLPQRFELALVQNRAPPNWQGTILNHTPIYLSTQRIRV